MKQNPSVATLVFVTLFTLFLTLSLDDDYLLLFVNLSLDDNLLKSQNISYSSLHP